MKLKLKTLTPVHIGTGNSIDPLCFKKVEGDLYSRYSLESVFAAINPEDLLDPDYLNALANSGSQKKSRIYDGMDIDYSGCDPLYQEEWHYFKAPLKSGKSVSEQMRNLEKPMIPGSSIKGAIENALKYTFIKNHAHECQRAIRSYFKLFDNPIDNKEVSDEPAFLLYLLKPDLFWNNKSDEFDIEKAKEFMDKVYGCLEVSDVFMKQTAVYDIWRINIDSTDGKNKDMEIGLQECIPPGEETEAACVISINETIKKWLLDQYSPGSFEAKVIQHFLNLDSILRSVSEFTYDNLENDYLEYVCSVFDIYNDGHNRIIPDLDTVNSLGEGFQASRTGGVLRLGKGNGYFSKTVSWFFANDLDSVFYDPEIFELFFSPASNNEKPDPNTFPKTRTVTFDENDSTVLGFVELTVC